MEALPGGLQQVQANVPLAEVMRYQTELKSMTGGRAFMRWNSAITHRFLPMCNSR